MAKKTKTKKKDLLKKEPAKSPNLTYEEKVAIKTSGVPTKTKTVDPPKSVEKDSHVQFVRARPATPINGRERNN
tara:strand:- start:2354 stop:2575 length:222 start_codon:yes stop_codon:yes gene_type:complete